MKKLLYKEIKPDSKLSQLIFNYWYFAYIHDDENKILNHIVPPDACASLMFLFNQKHDIKYVYFVGPSVKSYTPEILPGSQFVGIRIYPSQLKTLFDINPSDIGAAVLPADPLICSDFKQSVFAQIENGIKDFQFLDGLLKKHCSNISTQTDSLLLSIIDHILMVKGLTTVSELVKKFSISERQLHRKFKEAVGLTPIQFIRIRRVRASIIEYILEQNDDLAGVSIQHGYYDQSHWIKELQKITGHSPTTIKAYLSQIEHQNVFN